MVVYDLQAVTKQYPQQPQPANQHITLQIHAGEIFGLLGDFRYSSPFWDRS